MFFRKYIRECGFFFFPSTFMLRWIILEYQSTDTLFIWHRGLLQQLIFSPCMLPRWPTYRILSQSSQICRLAHADFYGPYPLSPRGLRLYCGIMTSQSQEIKGLMGSGSISQGPGSYTRELLLREKLELSGISYELLPCIFPTLDMHPSIISPPTPPTQGPPLPQSPTQQPAASPLQASQGDAVHSSKGSGAFGEIQVVMDVSSSTEFM